MTTPPEVIDADEITAFDCLHAAAESLATLSDLAEEDKFEAAQRVQMLTQLGTALQIMELTEEVAKAGHAITRSVDEVTTQLGKLVSKR
jgi:hypothetical protein